MLRDQQYYQVDNIPTTTTNDCITEKRDNCTSSSIVNTNTDITMESNYCRVMHNDNLRCREVTLNQIEDTSDSSSFDGANNDLHRASEANEQSQVPAKSLSFVRKNERNGPQNQDQMPAAEHTVDEDSESRINTKEAFTASSISSSSGISADSLKDMDSSDLQPCIQLAFEIVDEILSSEELWSLMNSYYVAKENESHLPKDLSKELINSSILQAWQSNEFRTKLNHLMTLKTQKVLGNQGYFEKIPQNQSLINEIVRKEIIHSNFIGIYKNKKWRKGVLKIHDDNQSTY